MRYAGNKITVGCLFFVKSCVILSKSGHISGQATSNCHFNKYKLNRSQKLQFFTFNATLLKNKNSFCLMAKATESQKLSCFF